MYTCLSDGTIANDDTWNAKDVVSGRVEECRARLCVWEIAIRQRRDNHPYEGVSLAASSRARVRKRLAETRKSK